MQAFLWCLGSQGPPYQSWDLGQKQPPSGSIWLKHQWQMREPELSPAFLPFSLTRHSHPWVRWCQAGVKPSRPSSPVPSASSHVHISALPVGSSPRLEFSLLLTRLSILLSRLRREKLCFQLYRGSLLLCLTVTSHTCTLSPPSLLLSIVTGSLISSLASLHL